jgi:hypothetical protein
MPILSAADCERLILALLDEQPLSAEDRRALILELVAARRRALDHASHAAPPPCDEPPVPDLPRRRWAFVTETVRRG